MLGSRSSSRLRFVALAAAIGLSLSSRIALADASTEAANAFEEGQAAYDRHDYRAAAEAFEASFRHAPRGASANNAAAARLLAGDKVRAADDYVDALGTTDLVGPARQEAEARLTSLRRTLGWVRVTGKQGTTVSVAHVQTAPLPKTIHLAPGHYTLRFSSPSDATESLDIDVSAGRETAVAVAVAVTRGPANVSAEPPAPPEPPLPPREIDSGTTQRTFGWIAVGVGVASTGTAIALGAAGLSAVDRYDDSRRTDASARADAITFRTAANVGWIVAAVTGLGGIALLLTSPSRSASACRGCGLSRMSVNLGPTSVSWAAAW